MKKVIDCTPTVEGVVIDGKPQLQVKRGQYIVGTYSTVKQMREALKEQGIDIIDLVIKEKV